MRSSCLVAVALLALWLTACPPPAGTTCNSTNDCRADEICFEQRCRVACNSNIDCRGSEECRSGFCQARADAGAGDGSPRDRAAADQASGDDDRAAGDRPPPDSAPHDVRPDQGRADASTRDATTPDRTAPDAAVPDTATADSGLCTKPALSFDGVDDYFEVPDHGDLDNLGALTVEAWVNTPATISSTTRMRIVSHHTATSATGYALVIYSGGASFYIASAGTATPAEAPFATYPFISGQWHHVAGTYDGSVVRIFVDGQLQDSASSSAGPADYAGPLTVGTGAADRDYSFVGVIDEVRITRGALYVSDFTPPTEPLTNDDSTIVLWHLDEGSGQTIADAQGDYPAYLGATGDDDPHDPEWVLAPCIGDRNR